MVFEIKSFDDDNKYSKNYINSLSEYYKNLSSTEKLDFIVIRASKDTISLVNITALLISDINFAVLSEEMEKNKIKHLFANKNILVLDNKKFFKLNNREFPKSLFSEKLKKAERNENRKILYLSSGSTGNPKLIENNSKAAFLCHKKVINLFKIDNNLKHILCFHSNSFVISLNYVLLGLLLDLELITIYKGGPLKLISSIKKIGTNSIIISVPSFWEKLVLIIAGQSIKINTVISCGEPLKFDTAKTINKLVSNQFFNFYGAAEFSTWIFYFLITNDYLNDKKNKDEIFVPIGNTLKEVNYVIDQNDLLGINCEHMASFYIKDKFQKYKVDSKLIKQKTFIFVGDRIKIKEGKAYCLGRIDGLVKIKGIFVDIFKLQELLVKICKDKQFVFVVGRDETIYLFIDSNNITKEDKEFLDKKILNNIKKILNPQIILRILFEDKGLKLNRSSKVDKFYYKQLVNK